MDSLLWVSVAQSCFAAIFLASKKEGALDDKILAAWMFVFVLPVLSGHVTRAFPDTFIPILSSHFMYPLTHGPFMWIYMRTLTGDIDRLGRSELIHFAPFLVLCVFQILTGWSPERPSPRADSFGIEIRVLGSINLAVLLAYNVAIFKRLFAHDTEILQHFSELSGRVTLGWLRWIAVSLFVVFLLLFMSAILSVPSLIPIHIIAQTAFIFVLSFFGFRQTKVFARSIEMTDNSEAFVTAQYPRKDALPEPTYSSNSEVLADTEENKTRYSRSGLTKEHSEYILEKLLHLMRSERPYLDPEITIEKLAKRLAVKRHHLTEVINGGLEKNFFLFINEYRIASVKHALAQADGQNRTLLDTAYDAGFNSKSSFNLAFKRIMGTTPSQYRKQQADHGEPES